MNSVPVKPINLSKEMGIDVLYDNYQYTIVHSYLMGTFPIDQQINTYIQNGWKLYGELIKSGDTYFQAMIRKLPVKAINHSKEIGIDVLYDNYQYMIVKAMLMGTFPIDKRINTHISEGWKLYGELIKSGDIFFQAMIKKLPAKGGNRTRRNR